MCGPGVASEARETSSHPVIGPSKPWQIPGCSTAPAEAAASCSVTQGSPGVVRALQQLPTRRCIAVACAPVVWDDGSIGLQGPRCGRPENGLPTEAALDSPAEVE